MATTLDERRQKPTTRPAAAMDLGMVDGAAPLNLTPPGTMKPDAPAPVQTQPAPQFDRTNAGPMLRQPPAPVPPAPAVDLNQQRMANQSAMYVQGAQAAAAARPQTPAQQMVDAPAMRPAADPMAGQAAFVSPRMGAKAPGSVAAPAAAAPVREGDPGWRTKAVMDGAAQDAQAAFDKGQYAQTAGALVRGAATAIPTALYDFGEQTVAPIASGIASFGRGLLGMESQPTTPAAQAMVAPGNEGRRTPMPVAPAVNPAGPRATNEAQAKNPAADQGQVPGAAKPMPQGAQPEVGPPSGYTNTRVDGVYRKGNAFTDEAGTRDTAFQNRGPVSAQNMKAADQLAANYNSNQQALARLQANNTATQPAPAAAPRQFDRAASIRALSDLRSPEAIALRNLRIDAQEEARDSARMGRAGRGNNAAGQAYAALLGELTTGTRQGQVAEMQDGTNRYTADRREEGATQRALMGEEGATRRAGMTNEVQQGELGLKREAQNITRERDQRLRKAEDDFLNETDPAKREAKARTLQALMGKGDGTPAGKDRYITLGGGSRVENGFTVTEPQRVFDTATGREIGAGPAAAAQVPPAAIDMLKKNPGMAAQFDQKFGPGASARYLNQ